MSFGRNFEFWGVGVAECKKTSILKTEFSSPLKIVFSAFHESVTRELVVNPLTKCADEQGRISLVKSESRTFHEGVMKLSA